MKGMIRLSLVALLCWPVVAEEWTPAEGRLMTRWAEGITPDKVWPEYPRPQMVRENWVNLNGLWEYAIRPRDEGQPEAWDGSILVPFCVESALSGVMRRLDGESRLWYHRTFEVAEMEGRLLLHFGAVDWHTIVWVNGEQVGENKGGYNPFSFDITDALRSGTNTLVVSVWDPTDEGDQPRGKQVNRPGGIWYTPVSGIWQTVWLEPVPDTYIRRLRVVPDVDSGTVHVGVDAVAPEDAVYVVEVNGHGLEQHRVVSATPQIEVPIPDPRLWSPGAPNLYDFTVRLMKGDRQLDAVDSYFGLRKIEVKADGEGINRLFLNGEPLFQFGFLDQGWWPDGLYTPPTDEAIRHDLEVTRELGMNMARKHVKYESARWYYWADKLGVLVWQDMPSGHYRTPEGQAQYEVELRAMIEALHPFPSIVQWIAFNEGWGQHNTGHYVELIAGLDPSRLVGNASGWHDVGGGGIRSIHSYPGPGMPPLVADRASVLGEFGGLGLPVQGHTWQDERNWGYRNLTTKEQLTEEYTRLLGRLRPMIGRGLSAAVYTQTSDVEIEVNGLMTYDRAMIKVDVERAREAALSLLLPPPVYRIVVPTALEEQSVWRYTMEQPADGWEQVEFDDSAWGQGAGGFGSPGVAGGRVGTRWDTEHIWIRRTFELGEIPANLRLLLHHDEDAQVYLNGIPALTTRGYLTSYEDYPIRPEALAALKKGKNVIAIHCINTSGGQHIDAGLVVVEEQEEPAERD